MNDVIYLSSNRHPGFPHESEFFCPVWTQDKARYLIPLLLPVINPTLVIAFNKWLANARTSG